jgi:DNA-binding phage protein
MRDGTEMGFSELRAEAETAINAAGKSYAEVARDLGVHRTAVARAVNENGPKFQSLQRRIVEHLTLYRIERQVRFKAHRNDE